VSATPVVTVGLPVYNGERYLAESIDSILGQSASSLRLVISDNASTDRTPEIIRDHASRDDRVVSLRTETNRGAAWNFNRVFAACDTPYFKWAAADDVLAPTCIERLLEALSAAPPEAVLAFPHTVVIGEEGGRLGEYVDALATRPDDPPHRRFGHVVRNMLKGNLVFALMRSEGLRRTRLHGSYPSSDFVLLAELALVGSFVEVPEPLFLRRDHTHMSRRANATLEEISLWFDPDAAPTRNETWRLFREHVAAVGRADLPAGERALALATLLQAWGERRWLPAAVARARSTARLRTRAREVRGRWRR
jgi:glycosyltransferase involved in cell wall biosynthesis